VITFRKIGSYLATGFVAQAAQAIAGLLLVRWMAVGEYAIYTVGITVIGAISLLTRGGVQMGLAAALAKAWPDPIRSSEAVAATMKVRMLVSALTMPAILAISWFLLDRAGAGNTIVIAILAILALVWLADTRGAVIDQVLFFDGKAVRIQALDTAIAIIRLVLVLALRLASAVSAVAALLTNLFTVAGRVPFVQRWVNRALGGQRAAAPVETTREIRKIALRQIPVDVFMALQAQAAIFFLTRHGGGMELATYGALARISQILTPFASLSIAFFVPAFAQIRTNVAATILKYVALGTLPSLLLLGWALAAPRTLLFFVGPAYADQVWPLIVVSATVAIMSAVQVAWSLISHRGWNRWGWVRIAIGVAWIGIGPLFLNVQTAAGAYWFYCGFSIGTVVALALDLYSAQAAGEIRLGRGAVPAESGTVQLSE